MIEKRIASVMALASFAMATFLGFAAKNSPEVILWRALIAMMICYVAGWVIGYIAGRVVRDNVDIYREANPIQGKAEEPKIEEGEAVEVGEVADVDVPEDAEVNQQNLEGAGAAL